MKGIVPMKGICAIQEQFWILFSVRTCVDNTMSYGSIQKKLVKCVNIFLSDCEKCKQYLCSACFLNMGLSVCGPLCHYQICWAITWPYKGTSGITEMKNEPIFQLKCSQHVLILSAPPLPYEKGCLGFIVLRSLFSVDRNKQFPLAFP